LSIVLISFDVLLPWYKKLKSCKSLTARGSFSCLLKEHTYHSRFALSVLK
jgi:hypothetical protein